MIIKRSWHSLRIVLSLYFITLTWGANAQRFGGNPPSLKWKQIDTDTVRVIFPGGLEKDAQTIAGISHVLNRETLKTIGTEVKKINIVLQRNTVVSNAYVGLAPWRSEYYMTPMQNSLELGSLPWAKNLAIHETRHVQQFMNFRKGLSKFAYIIAGQEGQALANSAAVPDWFFEGDAVFQETLVSEQGRGRLPEFFNGYRSLDIAGKKYRYMKLRNGSLKDYVPDHYQLGYLLVNRGREKYGDDFWKKVTSDAVRYKPLFYPLQGAFKGHADTSFSSFVADAINYFHEAHPDDTSSQHRNLLTPADSRYVKNYQYPVIIGPDSLLVLRSTYRDIPAWYIITGNKLKKIATRDIANDLFYSYKNGWVVYTTYKTDARWSWMDFSNIFLLNIRSKTRIKLTTRSKYFAPDLSNDGSTIAAVEIVPGKPSSVHLLNSGTGDLVRSLPNPENLVFTYPVFSGDDRKIFSAVRNVQGEMAVVEIDAASGNSTILIPYSYHVISFLRVKGSELLFTASHNRKDEVWSYHFGDQQMRLLASHVTGSYQADMDEHDRSIVYSGFTAEGMLLYREKSKDVNSISPKTWAGESTSVFSSQVVSSERLPALIANENDSFTVTKYKGGKHIFNFHSWRPYYERPDWSLTFYSQNILNNFRTDIYYQYNENERFNKIGINGNFAALYPWLTGGISYTFDRKYDDTVRSIRWNEFNANAGFRLPFNFSGGRFYKYLTLASSFNSSQLYFKENSRPKLENDAVNYILSSLSFAIESQQARQHIYPRYAFSFFAQQKFSVDHNAARQLLLSGSLYLPGILKTHNLVINGAYQQRDTLNRYRFSNSFPLSRGYPSLDFDRMYKAGGNYHLPLILPDIGIAQIVYFLRVRANVFYDVSWVKTLRTGNSEMLRSVGTEIFFDTRWWNQQPVTFGFRYSRLLDNDKFLRPPGANQWEFILPVNLLSY
ncbi:hypothetical protein [Pollutibacter soli]|uniref:hypothetical protein n=1 Tax=Pollutibacter soli TaxID=3034157 RepID=UPI0030136AC6